MSIPRAGSLVAVFALAIASSAAQSASPPPAKRMLDGKLWLDDVGKATHYHAYWVRPWWARSMRKLDKIGVHTFYRPRRWGDGSDEPIWGDAKTTTALVKTL